MSAGVVGVMMGMCTVAGLLIGAAVGSIITTSRHNRIEPEGRHAAGADRASTYERTEPPIGGWPVTPLEAWPEPLSPRLTDPRPAAPEVEPELPVQYGTRPEHQRRAALVVMPRPVTPAELEFARGTLAADAEAFAEARDAFLRTVASTGAAAALSVVDAVARPLGVGRFRPAAPAPDPERELVLWLTATGQLRHLTTEDVSWQAA